MMRIKKVEVGNLGPDDVDDSSIEDDAMNPCSENPRSISSGAEDGTSFAPNRVALAILKQVRDRQQDRRETDGSRTQELIREARAGGMYGS